MPSPLPSASMQNGVHAPTAVQNGSIEDGNTAAHNADVPTTNGASPHLPPADPTTTNTIEEGKQKAKAIMAASTPSGMPPLDSVIEKVQASSPEAIATHSKGSEQSRKRSRSGTRIPQTSQHEPPARTSPTPEERKRAYNMNLEKYVNRHMVHEAAASSMLRAQNTLIDAKFVEKDWYKHPVLKHERQSNPGAIFGYGYAGYGNGITNTLQGASKIIYPADPDRKRPGGRKTRELKILRKDRATQAEQVDELVPIRLDIEWEKIRLRDTFTWNIHDRVVPLDLFAEKLVEDFNLPLQQCQPLVQQVCAAIQEQIHDFHPHVFIQEDALDPHLVYHAYKNDEMRITIKLNITIGQHTLVDQFEWEINDPQNVPEEFARQMTRDLALSGEFTTAIAHSIREQSQLFTRSLYVTGHPFDGRPVEDQELKSSFLASPLPSSFRPFQAAKEYTPYLYELNELELEKTELSLSREERRQKRSVNRRGGPALPDLKDRRRTIRTLVVSSVLPGAAETIEDSRIFKRTVTSSGKGRRPGLGHRDGVDDSDDSESEDSSPDSPAIQSHLLAGTARTRGMRGAASAAQAAMRTTVGRSATPESSALHHHETRTSGRRTTGREYREDSSVDPPTTLIIKLRIPRQRFQQLLRDQRARSKEESLQPQPSNARPSTHRSPSTTSVIGNATAGSMGPPATTPRMHQQSLPAQTNGVNNHQRQKSEDRTAQQQAPASQLGRIEAQWPLPPDQQVPPPPQFLVDALTALRVKYPLDSFEGFMRYTAVSTVTDLPISLRPDAPPPPDTRFYYYPRIRCKDCPGKLYTPGPLMTVENFEVHLKNRNHRDKVARRMNGLPTG
ncbi:SWI/SNF chromatin-remodeling complex subunit [Xylographa bjoerkii]|nr:SWI/SNF chromatin-remodeling complex subunit [Xylographa bjoerkii]